MLNEKILKNEERAVFVLRALYKSYGYMPYKMSKFEEYDLYVRNKDFLVSDRVITFNDTNGRLLALKPDVTLSIIKNGGDAKGEKQKVYYNENVYRISERTRQYKEIMQTGIECIGDIDAYDIYEVVLLAAKSLENVSGDFMLDISHLGILSALLDEISDDEKFRKEIVRFIAEKNAHDIRRLCARQGLAPVLCERLCSLVGVYGKLEEVMPKLEALCGSAQSLAQFSGLYSLYTLLKNSGFADRINFDFSVVNDMNYYNGIVFKGFLRGISEGVLSGGQYSKLMRRMGRKSDAVGFAFYLDLLEDLKDAKNEYDVDYLILYDEKTDASFLAAKAEQTVSDGKSITVQKAPPEKIRYQSLIDLRTEDC